MGLFVVTAGWLIGLRPLADNSFLTHLATGRFILETGSVPGHDPYTFTAAGEPWVVQSWLVSVLYATAESLGGLGAVRIVVGFLAALLTGLGWRLLAPADGVVPRLAAAALFVGVGASLWAERPLMVGLICLAIVLLALEQDLDPRWLLPMGWLWVNSHGSFPLGVVLVVLSAVGRRLEGGSAAVEWRALRWFLPGVLLGAVGPLGWRVLVFPLELLERQDVLRNVIEWRAPEFDTIGQRLFILQLMVTIVLLARRPSRRHALLVATFAGAALLSLRNVPVASLVMLPAMAEGLVGMGSLSSHARPRVTRMVATVAVAALVVATAARFAQNDLELRKYPVAPLAYLESNGVDLREVPLAAPDLVGNLVDYVYGAEQQTFYDDRFDMFPEDVTAAHASLLTAAPDMREQLDDFDIDLVALRHASPSAQILTLDLGWRRLLLDDEWVLVCRRGAEVGGSIGEC